MTTHEKLAQKLADKKQDSNWTASELSTLLKISGYELCRIRGSHHIFQNGLKALIVPFHGKKIDRVYVKYVREKL